MTKVCATVLYRLIEIGRDEWAPVAGLGGLGAGLAQPPHETLPHDPAQDIGQKVVLHAQIDQARQGGDGGVGVDRGDHHVTGQGRLYRDPCGLRVADFADHDHVRVLAQD